MKRSLQAGSRSGTARDLLHDGAPKLPLQTGALPWRRNGAGRTEVLLVTSRTSGRWIIPKGQPMANKTLAEAAAIEAFEEAGVEGEISPHPLGEFEHEKSHWLVSPVRYRIVVHSLEVRRELAQWPEQAERKRRWLLPGEAAAIVRSDQLADLLRQFEAESQPPLAHG